MSWDYRVMKHVTHFQDSVETWYGIHEVFYNQDGKIVAWTQEPIDVVGDSYMEILETLERMLNDIETQSVLDYNMEPEGKWDYVKEEKENR